MTTRPLRVCHVISGLRTGGAELMLSRLIDATEGSTLESSVVSLSEESSIGQALARRGVAVTSLGLAPRRPYRAIALPTVVRSTEPDIIQGWMYHGNVAATIASTAHPRVPLVWNVRGTLYDLARERPLTRLMVRLGRLLSRRPARIIYDSRVSRSQHERFGFSSAGGVHIPNGFDVLRFRPDGLAKARLRERLGLRPEARFVGQLARFHPQKNHAGLIAAFAAVRRAMPNVHLVLAGCGTDNANAELALLADREGVAGSVHGLGEERNVPGLLAALDVLCISSTHGEGTPNVLGEAMACGVVCVATDVGDAGVLLDETGYLVRPGDVPALAAACLRALSLDSPAATELGARARLRISDHFSMTRVAAQYVALYREVAVSDAVDRAVN